MKLRELFEDGRIVKGVNTTADVGPNEIKIQTAKFGNTVDKDGKPPTLSKKVKGSSTNVLFNLGLSEGYQLKLERDEEIDVLHILDTKTKKRIEVRGKKGYETDGYDPQDKLHQVLDKVGRSASVSELMNGDVVGINPKHPQGADAEKTAKDVLTTESFIGLEESLPSFASAKASAKQYEKYVQDTFQAGKDGVDIYIDDGLEVTVDVIRKWGVNDTTVIKMLMDYYESRVGKVTEATFNMGLAESLDLAEAVGEIASATEIYVDMDGVLADFFGEWAKLMDVDHFSDIGKQHDINDALQKIRDTDDFWLRLPILPEAKNLLNLIKQVRGEYSICTSPLADDPNSEKHKRTWVEKNLAFFPPKEVHVTHNKPQFATAKDGTPNILIDDYGVNINAWEAAGGIGFKYKDHKFERTAKDIKQHIQEPVEEKTNENI